MASSLYNPDQKTVVKSNDFINGKYHFSLLQSRILLAICSLVQKDDPVGEWYPVNVAQIYPKQNSNNYAYIEQEAEDLIRKVDLPVSDPRHKGFKKHALLTDVDYPRDGSGIMYCKFHEDMKPHMLSMKDNYTKYSLHYVWSFTYLHSIRIYELLKEYQGKKQMCRSFQQEELKELLGIKESYRKKNSKGELIHDFYEFKRNVLNRAAAEIKKHSDIYFELEAKRQGHRVHTISFQIFPNLQIEKSEQKQTSQATTTPLSHPAAKSKLSINNTLIQQLSASYSEALVLYAIDQIAFQKQKGKGIINEAGYLIKGLKEGFYTAGFETQQKEKEKKYHNKLKKEQQQLNQQQKQQIYSEFNAKWRKLCISTVSSPNYADEIQLFYSANKEVSKMKQIVAEIEKGEVSEETALTVGNYLLQKFGAEEDYNVNAYAKKYHNINLEAPEFA